MIQIAVVGDRPVIVNGAFRLLRVAGVTDVVLVGPFRNLERLSFDRRSVVFVVDDPPSRPRTSCFLHKALTLFNQVTFDDSLGRHVPERCRHSRCTPHVHIPVAATGQTLLRAIRIVSPGQDDRCRDEIPHGGRVPRLSTRERHVLVCWLRSGSKVLVATELAITVSTVDTYLARIRRKYALVGREASSKTSLAARAVEDGLVHLEMIC